MSPTMFLGRVVLPAVGLAVAVSLSWNSMTEDSRRRPKPVGDRPGTSALDSDRPAESPPRGGSSPIPAPR